MDGHGVTGHSFLCRSIDGPQRVLGSARGGIAAGRGYVIFGCAGIKTYKQENRRDTMSSIHIRQFFNRRLQLARCGQ